MHKLLVISSYPSKGEIHHRKTVGIASYAKNTLLGIKENSKEIDILVLAEKLQGEPRKYEDGGIKVRRVWERGSFLSFPLLFLEALRNPLYKNVLLEFEVSMFGNPTTTFPLPFFIFILRVMGKNVTVVSHQAITNLEAFEGHTNIKGSSLKGSFLSFAIGIFYSLLLESSNKIIVFEKSLKDKLSTTNSKIIVIPHGVQNFKSILSKDQAKEKLGIGKNKKIILLFGYVAWYKGTDWAVEQFKKLKKIPLFKDYILVIAGGPNPNHKDKKFYTEYLNRIKDQADNKSIIYTGFVDERDIPTYYASSEAVILPYRGFMSASGPLSLAYSFGKPAFISSNLSPILDTSDIKNVILKRGLKKEDLVFELTTDSFMKVLGTRKEDRLIDLAKDMKEIRNFKKIGKNYIQEIYER